MSIPDEMWKQNQYYSFRLIDENEPPIVGKFSGSARVENELIITIVLPSGAITKQKFLGIDGWDEIASPE